MTFYLRDRNIIITSNRSNNLNVIQTCHAWRYS